MQPMTNAQVALMAAVEASKNMNYVYSESRRVLKEADIYKKWLDDNS